MTAAVQFAGNVSGPDAPAPAEVERPENVPEKFWNADTKSVNTEALLQSYAELERRQSQKAPEPPTTEGAPETTPEAKTESAPEAKTEGQPEASPEEAAAREAAASAGVDYDAMRAKFDANGSLEDSDFEALEKAGIPRTMVEDFIAGQQALADRARSELLAPVGGDEGYDAMVEWARTNMAPADIAAYDAIVTGDNPAAMKFAIEGLYAKYKAATPSEPNLLNGAPARGAGAYASVDEMKADMRDPRYRKDQAFRDQVDAKIARTTAF
ncbi:hypothetical protein AncyloWKF20_07535 [Ancylobacter sp. WKF20]|uniref:capsid assembly protein n=1 Tax=Ancylobacter sp. WKF20 TaxID=3039801 RepID=UPI00243439F5|nr:hypothetical protein [Ancylobacter sp. WKF20]WGD31661.1 hypothetical protein AncyloWKF20_07535 [Ancylobacter sp. WKF20]